MGIFSAIGAALKNPDVQDRLAAIGSTLQGDTEAAQTYQQRVAQREAMDQAAAKLEALREAEQAPAITRPSPPVPVTVSPLPTLAPRTTDSAATAPAAPTLAPPPAEPVAPVSASPAAPTPRSIYAEMLPQLIRASGRGADVGGLLTTLQNEDYIRSLPTKDQTAARLNPARFAGWDHDDNKPVVSEVGPGNSLTRYDPRSQSVETIFTQPFKPAGPLNESELRAQIIADHRPGGSLAGKPFSPVELQALGVRPDPVSMDRATAEAWGRVNAGSGSANDQRLVDAYIASKQSGGLGGLLSRDPATGGDQETPTPPGAKALPQKPAKATTQAPVKLGSTPANPISVRTPDEARKLAPGTYFRDPAGLIRQR